MRVEINKKEVELPEGCDNIISLLQHQEISEKGHAVAVNNYVLPRAEWASFRLESGMKVIIIRAVRGG